jgi:hypothetical protein
MGLQVVILHGKHLLCFHSVSHQLLKYGRIKFFILMFSFDMVSVFLVNMHVKMEE